MTYGKLIGGLKKKNIEINRKVLAHLAMNEPESFTKIIEQVRAA
jgi:large subunit ribosomal protein L20